MWRSQTLRKGGKILSIAQRHLAAEASGGTSAAPPPRPKSGGFRFFKFIGLGLPLASTSVLAYAWYDTDFRNQLEANVPYAKELLENVLPSENPASPGAVSKGSNMLPFQEKSLTPHPIQDSKSPSPTVLPMPIVPSALCATSEKTTGPTENTNLYYQGIGREERKVGSAEVEPKEAKVDNGGDDVDKKATVDDKLSNETKNQNERGVKIIDNLLSKQQSQTNVQVSVPQPTAGVAKATSSSVKETKQESMKIEDLVRKKELEDKADNAALEVVVAKLLESGHDWVSEAAKAQLDVARATRNHSSLLKKAMDESTDVLHKDVEWEAVTIAYREREIAVTRANELVDEAKKSIDKLKQVLDEAKASKVTAKNSAINPATKKIAEFSKNLAAAGAQVRHADSDAKVMLKYKDLVDKGKKQFQLELESLLPDAKPGSKSRKLTEEELNALIAHAHRRIEQLQKQIAEQLAMERKRLSAALDTQREEDEKITNSAVADEHLRMLHEFELEKQKLEVEWTAQMEIDVRKQLSRQAAAHSDHLREVLAVQEDELSKGFERKMNMKLLEERDKFQSETSGWISRLKGIEAAVDARAASEKLAQRAQDLWLACIALNSTIMFGNDEEKELLTPLRPQVEAVINSATKHPFVETVANSIPAAALDRGVYTENDLRDRFVRVSQISRRLGLIQESNASLYKYLVSFLHSFFTVRNVSAYSEKDLVTLDDMDNFELVANAQYWMEKGNLEMALRFMNQLKGESKSAARDWIGEARLLLETRQAAQTITAFASATGLAATF